MTKPEIRVGDIVEHTRGLRSHVVDFDRDTVTGAYRCGRRAGRWPREDLTVVSEVEATK